MKYLVAQHGNLSGAYVPQIGYEPGSAPARFAPSAFTSWTLYEETGQGESPFQVVVAARLCMQFHQDDPKLRRTREAHPVDAWMPRCVETPW